MNTGTQIERIYTDFSACRNPNDMNVLSLFYVKLIVSDKHLYDGQHQKYILPKYYPEWSREYDTHQP